MIKQALFTTVGVAFALAVVWALFCLAAGTQDVYTNDSAYMMQDVGVE